MRSGDLCSPPASRPTGRRDGTCVWQRAVVCLLFAYVPLLTGQALLRPGESAQVVHVLPSDLQVLESENHRADLPCKVSQRKAELGFDLRFHTGFDVNLPMSDLAGSGNLLTIVFEIYPTNDPSHTAFFVQHFDVPTIPDDARGEAFLQGSLDMGEGSYHVDWLMRDRSERFCSSSWDVEASLPAKDKPMPLFIDSKQVTETPLQPFLNDAFVRAPGKQNERLDIKILVNFAPQLEGSASLMRSDTDALVTILKTLERNPNTAHISLVAFNMTESRVVYRQDSAEKIDYAALGKALQTMRLGTVRVQNLDKNSETDFLESLIQNEIGTSSHPDAVIFAGPKAMLKADVPQQDLRRIGDIDCPVFYLNYNVEPQAQPWKDSISHVIRVFKGTEYTISRPRDLWYSTSDVLGRILRFKRERPVATAPLQTTSKTANQ